MNKSNQKGITITQFILGVFLLGFFSITLIRVIPVYIEYFNMKGSLNSLKDNKIMFSEVMIRDSLVKRFYINNVRSVKGKDITVRRNSKGFEVGVKYDSTVHFFGNIDLVFHFNKQVDLPRHGS